MTCKIYCCDSFCRRFYATWLSDSVGQKANLHTKIGISLLVIWHIAIKWCNEWAYVICMLDSLRAIVYMLTRQMHMHRGPFYPHVWIRTRIVKYNYSFTWDVITYPLLNFNGSESKPPSNLGHGWVITSHCFTWMLLLIHVLNVKLV